MKVPALASTITLIVCGLIFGTHAVAQSPPFADPQGVAVDKSGNVFVADIAKFIGPQASEYGVKEIPAANGHSMVEVLGATLGPPPNVAVDGQGNLFIADPLHNAIKEVLAAGGYVTARTIGSGFNKPHGVAVDRNGNVFVADSFNKTVKEILAEGGYVTVNTLGGSFGNPQGVAVDASGNVFVADVGSGVKEILAEGGYLTVVRLAPDFSFSATVGVTVDTEGNVFVADDLLGRAFEIPAADGYTTVTPIGTPNLFPESIAVDENGNVFVGTGQNRQVFEIPVAGGYTTALSLANQREICNPFGVAVDTGGNIIVADDCDITIKQIAAAGGYQTVTPLWIGVFQPTAIALDGSGNLFVADIATSTVKEILAAGGYGKAQTIGTFLFTMPMGVAVDGNGNVFVADAGQNAVFEMLAAGSYATVRTLSSSFNQPHGVAVDGNGNVFVTDTGNAVVKEMLAVDGVIPSSPTINTIGGSFFSPGGITLDASGNVFFSDTGANAIFEILAAGDYIWVEPIASGFTQPLGVAVDGSDDVFIADSGDAAVAEALAATPILASVLPGSRSVQLGEPATLFATMLNTGTTALDNCQIALPPFAPADLTLNYQATDASTNIPVGMPNTPVTIAGDNSAQSFLVSIQSSAALSAPAMPLSFGCNGVIPAPIVPGVSTIDLTVSSTPVPDIIALSATSTNNGIVEVANGGAAAFAVASINVGASAPITVSIDTGTARLPVSMAICQTDPHTGECLAPPSSSVSLSFIGSTAPTFSAFLQATGPIAFAPATSRVFVRFEDSAGALHGSTSVAIATP